MEDYLEGKEISVETLKACIRKGTIEFRQHQGTLSTEKLKNWVEFLVNLIDYSKNHRFTLVDQGSRYIERLTNTMPYGTKLYRVFEMLQTPNGATTQQIMNHCNINDARSVRRTINTIRRKLGSTQSVTTLNQEFYGHLNGSSNGLYDLNGYIIPLEIERISQGSIQLNDSKPMNEKTKPEMIAPKNQIIDPA
mgnify:CR=1 FL=1